LESLGLTGTKIVHTLLKIVPVVVLVFVLDGNPSTNETSCLSISSEVWSPSSKTPFEALLSRGDNGFILGSGAPRGAALPM